MIKPSSPSRKLMGLRRYTDYGLGSVRAMDKGRQVLIPEEGAPQFLDDAAPRNGMMPPPDSEMIAPPIPE
jgi:hypothetical protein